MRIQQNQQKIYDEIMKMFREEDFHSHSLIQYKIAQEIFNKKAENSNGEEFDMEILADVWSRCQERTNEEVKVINIAEGFVEAVTILKKRIESLQGLNGMISDRTSVLQDKKNELLLFEGSTSYGNKHIFLLQSQIENIEQELTNLKSDHIHFTSELKYITKTLLHTHQRRTLSQQIDAEPPEQQHPNLLFLYWLNFVLLVVEMLVVKVRPSMWVILCCLEGWIVLFLGYPFPKFVLYLIVQIFASVLYDIGFLALIFGGFWDPEVSSASIPITFPIIFLFIFFLVISILLRLLAIQKWFHFRIIPTKCYFFSVHSHKFSLKKRLVAK